MAHTVGAGTNRRRPVSCAYAAMPPTRLWRTDAQPRPCGASDAAAKHSYTSTRSMPPVLAWRT